MYYSEARKSSKQALHTERVFCFLIERVNTLTAANALEVSCGNRTGALRQYESCAAALDEELSVKPAQSTSALFEQIRADQLQDQPPLRARIAALTPRQP